MPFALVSDEGVLRRIQGAAPDPTAEPKAGWSWLPVVESSVDTSTGPNKTTETTSEVVDGEWRITHTTRDLLAPEIDARNTNRVASEVDLALGRGLKLAFNALFLLANTERQRHGLPAITKAQFRTAVQGLNDFNDADFRDWLKSLL